MDKSEIRERIWRLLEENDIARFPRPVYGRIPNFTGADDAARLLITLEQFKSARIIKINPDAPQRMARYYALAYNKILVMPTPRLRSGFMMVNVYNPKDALKASTIKGALIYGRPFRLDRKIDTIVIGSVAVTRDGARLGKGEGYAEIEYAILKELGLVDDNVKIITIVHELQIVDEIPVEEYDLPVDIIITPREILNTYTRLPRPKGIIWEKLSEEKILSIPLLSKIRDGSL